MQFILIAVAVYLAIGLIRTVEVAEAGLPILREHCDGEVGAIDFLFYAATIALCELVAWPRYL